MSPLSDQRISQIEFGSWTHELHSPFIIAQRTAKSATNVLVSIATDAGLTGYGECAPVGYVTGESVESVIDILSRQTPAFIGQSVTRLQPLIQTAVARMAGAPSALAGMEMALYDMWAKYWGMPLWQFFGGSIDRLITDLTIPIVDPLAAARIAIQAYESGFRHFKIKVGDPGGVVKDRARIIAVNEAVPAARLRIDANQAFSACEAILFAQSLGPAAPAIELFEQPVHRDDVAGLRLVKERLATPIIADESAASLAAIKDLLREEAIDGVNIKLMKLGLSGSLAAARLCRAHGKSVMLGCMLESRLGISAAAHIAAGSGLFDYIDLDSHMLLKDVESLSGGFETHENALIMENESAGGWGVRVERAGLKAEVKGRAGSAGESPSARIAEGS